MNGTCGIEWRVRFGAPGVSPIQLGDREQSSVAQQSGVLFRPVGAYSFFCLEEPGALPRAFPCCPVGAKKTRGAAPGFRMVLRWGKGAVMHHCSRHSRMGDGGGGSFHRHEG